MRFTLLIPIGIMVFATLGMHAAACGMHVAAVDRMSNPEMRASYRGVVYKYCRFMSSPFRR